jgi:hypothetical protein
MGRGSFSLLECRHRAAAVIGRNGSVADDLDAAAERPRTRGAVIVAVSALRRSGALTPDPEAVRMANGTG